MGCSIGAGTRGYKSRRKLARSRPLQQKLSESFVMTRAAFYRKAGSRDYGKALSQEWEALHLRTYG